MNSGWDVELWRCDVDQSWGRETWFESPLCLQLMRGLGRFPLCEMGTDAPDSCWEGFWWFLLCVALLPEVRKLGSKQLERNLRLMRVVWLPPPPPTDAGALSHVCGASALPLPHGFWDRVEPGHQVTGAPGIQSKCCGVRGTLGLQGHGQGTVLSWPAWVWVAWRDQGFIRNTCPRCSSPSSSFPCLVGVLKAE